MKRCALCDMSLFSVVTLGNRCPVTGYEHQLAHHDVTDKKAMPSEKDLWHGQDWVWSARYGQWIIIGVPLPSENVQ